LTKTRIFTSKKPHFLPFYKNPPHFDPKTPFAVGDLETLLDSSNFHQVIMAGIRWSHKKRTRIWKNESYEAGEKTLSQESDRILKELLNAAQREVVKLQKVDSGKKQKFFNLYFHNLSRFDGYLLLGALLRDPNSLKEKPKVIFRNNRIYQILYKNLRIRDSFLLLPLSLEQLAQEFLGKSKYKFDPSILEVKNFWKSYDSLTKYLSRDVNLLMEILQSFRTSVYKDYQMEILDQLAISSLSFKVFRSSFMKQENIEIERADSESPVFLRMAYLGGMVDLYQPFAKEGVHGYDINSSYPAVMHSQPMPVGKSRWVADPKKMDFDNFFGFLDATVQVDTNLYLPPLPLYSLEDQMLIAPTGVFRAIFFSEELRIALAHGTQIKEIHQALQFQPKVIFKDFIEKIFNKRKEEREKGQYGKALISKLLMNSISGRFALRSDLGFSHLLSEDDVGPLTAHLNIKNPLHIQGTPYFLVNLLNSTSLPQVCDLTNPSQQESLNLRQELELKTMEDHNFSAVQIAAAITAYGRISIFQLKNRLLQEGYTLYYSDTDSLWISPQLPEDHPLLGDELGMLKKEGSYEKGLFLAPKVYALKKGDEEKIVIAGLDTKARHLLSFKSFEEIYFHGKFEKLSFQKFFVPTISKMAIQSKLLNYQPTFHLKKRVKLSNSQGLWVDTKPIQKRGFSNLRKDREKVWSTGYPNIYVLRLERSSHLFPFILHLFKSCQEDSPLDANTFVLLPSAFTEKHFQDQQALSLSESFRLLDENQILRCLRQISQAAEYYEKWLSDGPPMIYFIFHSLDTNSQQTQLESMHFIYEAYETCFSQENYSTSHRKSLKSEPKALTLHKLKKGLEDFCKPIIQRALVSWHWLKRQLAHFPKKP